MADELDFQILLELTYRADILSLHSQIYTLQNKNFCDFLEFMPDDENIILSDNDVEESNGGVFKN